MSLRHAVLGLLDEEPGSGYDLMKTFRESLQSIWPATQSQLYGELNRLTDAGLVEVTEVGPRGRKVYDITEAGQDELQHWILDVKPEGFRRNDLLLRVFLLGSLTPREGRTYLERHVSIVTDLHEQLLEQQKNWSYDDSNSLAYFGKLVLEWGVRLTEMQREWAQWALREIERDKR